jgi:hypothetical protein
MVDKTKPEGRQKAPKVATRFSRFMKANKVKPSRLARESGYSRQHILRVRTGVMDPTRHTMATITDAVSRVLGRPIYVVELFELGEMDEAFAAMRGVEDV